MVRFLTYMNEDRWKTMRPIDAVALTEGLELHRMGTDQEYEADRQWAVGYNAGLDRALYSIAYAKTITPTPPPNEALTLEELREMDGEPVWVKVSENWRESGVKDGWRLVRLHKSDDRLRLYFYDTHFGPTFVAEQDYVQSWIAYRRKPEGGI